MLTAENYRTLIHALADDTIEGGVRQAMLCFLELDSDSDSTFSVTVPSRGELKNPLDIRKDGKHLYGTILARNWVSWYFRKPAFDSGELDLDETLSHFEIDAPSKYGEIKVKVSNAQEARRVIAWIS